MWSFFRQLDLDWALNTSSHCLNVLLLQRAGFLLLLQMFLVLRQNFIDFVQAIFSKFHGSLLGGELVVRGSTAGIAEWLATASTTVCRGVAGHRAG